MTYKERFFVTSNGYTYYAPSTIGCPEMLMNTEWESFKKTDAEKSKLLTLKKQIPKARGHKFQTFMKESF